MKKGFWWQQEGFIFLWIRFHWLFYLEIHSKSPHRSRKNPILQSVHWFSNCLHCSLVFTTCTNSTPPISTLHYLALDDLSVLGLICSDQKQPRLCYFRYQWDIKYSLECVVWATHLWIWGLIRHQNNLSLQQCDTGFWIRLGLKSVWI